MSFFRNELEVEDLSIEDFDRDDYIEVKLSKIKSRRSSLEKYTPYTIISDYIDEHNGLFIKNDGFTFYVNLMEPFKYHRGTLNLDVCMNLYTKLLAKEFEDIATVEIKTEDEGSFFISDINFTVSGHDVEGFFTKLVKFEDTYSEKLKKLSDDIWKMIESL